MNSIYLLEKNGLMLNEFFDIYYYLVNRKLNPDELMERTQYYNVREYVYYCIYFTYELVKDRRLKKYLEKLYTPEAHELLEYYGLCNSERKKTGNSFLRETF